MKKHLKPLWLILINILFLFSNLKAQELTKVKGKVVDENNQALPFVNIRFEKAKIGTITDFDGLYKLESKWATDKITASFLGFKNQTKNVKIGSSQKIDFKLKSSGREAKQRK
jgi:hypothetical protein